MVCINNIGRRISSEIKQLIAIRNRTRPRWQRYYVHEDYQEYSKISPFKTVESQTSQNGKHGNTTQRIMANYKTPKKGGIPPLLTTIPSTITKASQMPSRPFRRTTLTTNKKSRQPSQTPDRKTRFLFNNKNPKLQFLNSHPQEKYTITLEERDQTMILVATESNMLKNSRILNSFFHKGLLSFNKLPDSIKKKQNSATN